MQEKYLINRLVNDFGYSSEIIISKFEDEQKEALIFEIQECILQRCNYTNVEYLHENITEAIDSFESNQLYAISDVNNITFTLENEFFKYLKEDTKASKNTKSLNEVNISNYLKINYTDDCDRIIEEFYKNTDFKNKLPSLYDSYACFLDSKATDYAKRKQVVLSPREVILVKTYGMLQYDRSILRRYRNLVSDNYSIFTNTARKNQEILNNSFDAIIKTLSKHPNMNSIVEYLEDQKYHYRNLFTNPKVLAQLKNANHHMHFLYKCNSIYTGYNTIVFQEVTEGLISGYLQSIEIEKNKPNIKSLKAELEVLHKYNYDDENTKSIEHRISFLDTKKNNHKFIVYKELSNRLIIDEKSICSYMNNISNVTHINTIKKDFITIKTIPMEIELSQF